MFTSRTSIKIIALISLFVLILGNVQPVSALAVNDNFAQALTISSIPYYAEGGLTDATIEDGEPLFNCGWYGQNPAYTIWFKYTPTANITLIASASDYYAGLDVFSGNSLNSLTRGACSFPNPRLVLQATAGITYYFRLQYPNLYSTPPAWISFTLQGAPPPDLSISSYFGDPSKYDVISMYANVNDQAGIYGGTYSWNFGDGTTFSSNSSSANHQYKADGDYTVNLGYTTADGRSATAQTTIQVRTRDIAIDRFSVPQTGRINQVKTISVEVINRYYSDNVRVDLYKGLPGGGEQQIGSLTIYVPTRTTRSTLFKFSYTITAQDAAIGKVTFRAVATLINGRDALPADNSAIQTTLVSK